MNAGSGKARRSERPINYPPSCPPTSVLLVLKMKFFTKIFRFILREVAKAARFGTRRSISHSRTVAGQHRQFFAAQREAASERIRKRWAARKSPLTGLTEGRQQVRIPVKPNADSEGKPNCIHIIPESCSGSSPESRSLSTGFLSKSKKAV